MKPQTTVRYFMYRSGTVAGFQALHCQMSKVMNSRPDLIDSLIGFVGSHEGRVLPS